MYDIVKAAMRKFGYVVSAGEHWAAEDSHQFRTFCHFILGVAHQEADAVLQFPAHYVAQWRTLHEHASEQTPTSAPTSAPTEMPTEAPTSAPTEMPTEAPTESPTQEPTEAPSATTVQEQAEHESDVDDVDVDVESEGEQVTEASADDVKTFTV